MKNIFLAVSALFISVIASGAGVLINGNQINPATNIQISSLTATYGVSAGSMTTSGAAGFLAKSGGVCESDDVSNNLSIVISAQAGIGGVISNSFRGGGPFNDFQIQTSGVDRLHFTAGGSIAIGSAFKSTFTVVGGLFMASGSSITLSGSAGYISGVSSITTTGSFFGDASHLTGTAASLTAGNVTTNANMTGDVTSSGSNATTAAATQSNIATLSKSGGVTITNGVSASTAVFGSGVNVSTFSSTGQLQVGGTGTSTFYGSTMTIATTGFINGKGQPFVFATETSNKLPTGVRGKMFWATPSAANNVGGMFGGSSSSNTFTVPVGGGGIYSIFCETELTTTIAAQIYVELYKNSSLINQGRGTLFAPATGAGDYGPKAEERAIALSPGDVIDCEVYQNESVTTITTDGNSTFQMIKIW